MAPRLKPGTGPLGREAVDCYPHLAPIILTRAATPPAPEAPLSPQALGLAWQLCDAIERRVDELGRPPRPAARKA